MREKGFPRGVCRAARAAEGVALAGLLSALLLVVLPSSAAAMCPGAPCCFEWQENSMVAQAEVTAVQTDGLSISLLQTPIYCDGGLECPAVDFPVEFSWGAGTPCESGCNRCTPLAVGERGVFVISKSDGCLLASFRVDGTEVDCDLYSAPVEFVLAQALDQSCHFHTIEAGYWHTCDDTEDCSDSTAGQGGGLVLGLVIGLGLLRRKPR
ncbi:MAG TPA: hypothetical protein PK668_18305 [Myxococcota bacterium]|nr:hypothetical protein [Myxococcota bacterium]HRY95917.1 hypothetical protein [Myxococcota bacterium]